MIKHEASRLHNEKAKEFLLCSSKDRGGPVLINYQQCSEKVGPCSLWNFDIYRVFLCWPLKLYIDVKKRRKYSSSQCSPKVDKRASYRATDQPVRPHLLYEHLEKH